jgi:hypothetical protein
MQRTLLCPPIDSADFESRPCFNVVMVYEDFETGKHAKQTYDYLVRNLGPDCHLTNQMWKFDVLSIPKLREIAIKDATQADIIVVSSRGGDLPEQVKEWIEGWLALRTNAIALVALFDDAVDVQHTRLVRAYLAGVAQRAKLEFFAQPDDWPGRKRASEAPSFGPSSDFSERTLHTLAGVVQRELNFPRWGINE